MLNPSAEMRPRPIVIGLLAIVAAFSAVVMCTSGSAGEIGVLPAVLFVGCVAAGVWLGVREWEEDQLSASRLELVSGGLIGGGVGVGAFSQGSLPGVGAVMLLLGALMVVHGGINWLLSRRDAARDDNPLFERFDDNAVFEVDGVQYAYSWSPSPPWQAGDRVRCQVAMQSCFSAPRTAHFQLQEVAGGDPVLRVQDAGPVTLPPGEVVELPVEIQILADENSLVGVHSWVTVHGRGGRRTRLRRGRPGNTTSLARAQLVAALNSMQYMGELIEIRGRDAVS